jgi:hypothetical protein
MFARLHAFAAVQTIAGHFSSGVLTDSAITNLSELKI